MNAIKEAQFVKLLLTRLSGRTFQVLHCNTYPTVNAFAEDVKRHFLKTRSLDEMMREIKSTMQKAPEDVFRFGSRLKQIAEKTKKGIRVQFQLNQLVGLNHHIDETAMSALKRNVVNSSLKQHMLGANQDNWEDLIQEAKRVETSLKQSEQAAELVSPVMINTK